MTVLVTGGTGKLGRAVSQAAAAAGHSLRIMSRRAQPHSSANSFEWVQADVTSGQGIREAVAGVDAVLHLATNPLKARAVDVDGTQVLVKAALASSVAHFIYISIVGIDDIPFSYYKRKLEAEELIKSSGLPHSILRATQFHSLVNGFVSAAGRVPLVMPLPTDVKFQSVDGSEVAALLVQQLAELPGGRLEDFGGPEVLTLGEMAEAWMDVKQIRKRLVHIPVPGSVAAAFRAGKNTAPNKRRGIIRWREWLIQQNLSPAA